MQKNKLGAGTQAIAMMLLTMGLSASAVVRDFADMENTAWTQAGYMSATGDTGSSEDVPPGVDSLKRSLQVNVRYSGKGFEFYGITPVATGIPGKCRKVSGWFKVSEPGFAWLLKFKDAQGRDNVGNRRLESGLRLRVAGEWVKHEFTIPEDWEQPLQFVGIGSHNHSKRTVKAEPVLLVNGLLVETDVGGVEDKGSLVSVRIGTDVERNIFIGGEIPTYSVTMDSWLGQEITGTLHYRIADPYGREVKDEQLSLAFTGAATKKVTFAPQSYGVHTLTAEVKLSNGTTLSEEIRFSYVPKPHDYSLEEKTASPWGINIHGGNEGVAYKGLARTGFVWIRDYAYGLAWMKRARGDGSYSGWPWYPKMDEKIREAGLMLLPCLQGAMKDYIPKGVLVPTREWKADILHILMSFPQYGVWELDNEYELQQRKAEVGRDWETYDRYHKVFAYLVKVLDEGTIAVENGTAGLQSTRARQSIARGAFDNIDVINGHFYCGTQPPEVASRNRNTGQEDGVPVLLYDNLRDFAEAADSDGKDRQAWCTEFGWDTLAVHIVTERTQAAYLQRGYLLQLQAGLDKLFWYWNRDTKSPPNNFFDGCGIFDPRDEPKPASAAMAAMVHFLKLPGPVGTFDVGPNSMGHVFRDRGRLVACAFKLEEDGPDVTATFASGDLFDLYGNPVEGRKHALEITPLWIVGVDETDPIVKQTAYDLASKHYVRSTAGDRYTMELRVKNNRRTSIQSAFKVDVPDGWSVDTPVGQIDVKAGETKNYPLVVGIDPKADPGFSSVTVTVEESGTKKMLTTKYESLAYADVKAGALLPAEGPSELSVSLINNSLLPRSFTLQTKLPKGWSATPSELEIKDMPGKATHEAEFKVSWNPNWKANEKAELVVLTDAGEPVASTPIIPALLSLASVKGIKIDGDLRDWPTAAKVPTWVLGTTRGEADANVYVGISDAGLHVAVEVEDSKADVPDPKGFWSGDCVEVFIDTANDKATRKAYSRTDHQFWLCPMVEQGRVYAGRWKRGDEIAATQYDIKEVKGVSRKTDHGYVMEVLLPAAVINGFSVGKGKAIGVGFSVTVVGEHINREVYWPWSKQDSSTRPHLWGEMVQ